MRILVTVKPKMYREALALHSYRPDDEVMLAPSESLDGEVKTFGPHLLVCNDTDGGIPEAVRSTVCRIDILFSDGMGARISMDGRVWKVEDMSVDGLLRVIDDVERLVAEETG